MQKQKIAIVCSGGGMRCAYSAGVLCALAREHKLTDPTIIIAASGSAGSSLYYIARQYGDIHDIWTQLLSTSKFISYFRLWKTMDIDYLIDTVFKVQRPLNIDAVKSSSTDFYIPITHSDSKKTRYITKSDTVDIFEALRATKAIPFVYGKKVFIQNEEYIDGVIGTSFVGMIKKAEELGATHIIAIDCHPFKKESLPILQTPMTYIKINRMNIHLLTRDSVKLSYAFNLGYEDAAHNKDLKKLLG